MKGCTQALQKKASSESSLKRFMLLAVCAVHMVQTVRTVSVNISTGPPEGSAHKPASVRRNSSGSAVVMEPGKRSKHRHGRYNNTEEPEYHVVDDQQEMLNVHIQPARPLQAEREYADRDLPRSSSAQSLCSNSSDTPPRCPPRSIPPNPGPAINRNLKPSRRRSPLDERAPAVEPREQHTQLSQRSPPSLTKDLANLMSELHLQRVSRRDGQKVRKYAEFSTPTEGLQGSESGSANHTNIRYSLDLDTPHHTDKGSQQKHKVQERSQSRRQNHEWPQTKEDFDQNDFVPKEKPHQTYYEEDWYIGTCNRAEAEHALHLVNKDGAFLVRNCSKSTLSEPFVLAVYHERKVYNVKIRFIESTAKYALGTGHRANDMFDSVADIIKFHSIFPVVLVDGRSLSASKYPGNCVLTYPITKKDVDQLLG